MAAAAGAITENGQWSGRRRPGTTLPIEIRQPVSPMMTTRFTTAFGSGRFMSGDRRRWRARGGSGTRSVVVVKTDGFELPDVIAAASVVSVLVGRSGMRAGQRAHRHRAGDAVDGD